jgi:hypothetical protein
MKAARTSSPVQADLEMLVDYGPLPDVENRTVVVVNTPSPFYNLYLPGLRAYQDLPQIGRFRALAPGYFAVDVTRLDETTLTVRPKLGYVVPPGIEEPGKEMPALSLVYFSQHLGKTYRSSAHPAKVGQKLEIPGMIAEVTELTEDRRIQGAKIQFAVPAEDPSLIWLQWNWKTMDYSAFSVPAVGETVTIPGWLN